MVYLILAAIVAFFFAMGSEGDATFRLGEAGQDIDLTFSAAGFSWVVSAIFAFLAVIHLTRGIGKKSNLVLSIALVLFAFAFLAWAAAGSSFSLLGMLRTTVSAATPIAFGALSGVLCERVAVINIGIEGMLLTGAFMSALVGTVTNPWVGLLAAALSGGVLALGLAVLAIRYRVDQIIAGVVINIFALGLTSFLSSQILVENPDRFNALLQAFLLLADIPVIGPIRSTRTSSYMPVDQRRPHRLRALSAPAGASVPGRWASIGRHPRRQRTGCATNVLGAQARFGGAYFAGIGSIQREHDSRPRFPAWRR